MNEGRMFHAVCNLGHHIFAIGGYNPCKLKGIQSMEVYNTYSDTWIRLASSYNFPDEYCDYISAQVA